MTQVSNENPEDEVKAQVLLADNQIQVVFDYPGGRRVVTLDITAFHVAPTPVPPKHSEWRWAALLFCYAVGLLAGRALCALMHQG